MSGRFETPSLRAWPWRAFGQVGLLAFGLAAVVGCGDMGGNRRNASGSAAGSGLVGSDVNSLASNPTQPPAAVPPVAPAPVQGAAPVAPPGGAFPGLPGVGVPGQPQPTLVTEKAQAGVSGKGNYGGPGAVTTPISVYFRAQEQLTFLKVEHAMKLFEAERGYKPKTEEEFMKLIVEANQIRLPSLPPGHKYKYDPQTGALLVEHPQ